VFRLSKTEFFSHFSAILLKETDILEKKNVVTGGENWFFDYNPETKAHASFGNAVFGRETSTSVGPCTLLT
jgi:hypothetical protein